MVGAKDRIKRQAYGVGGQGLTITDGSGNLMSGETYFGGRYLGTQTPSGFVYAYADGLGSEHVRSTGEKDTNWPFGEFPVFQNGVSPVHFTGKPHDSETGLDYLGARYYAPTLGRFMTPDWSATPEPIPYANLANPQSLNLYAYVCADRNRRKGEDERASPGKRVAPRLDLEFCGARREARAEA